MSAGSGLSGGGTNGNVPLSLNTAPTDARDAHPELYGQPEEQGTQWAYDREGLKRQKEERLQREAAARQ